MSAITRGGLPAPVANAIIEAAAQQSAIMKLARRVPVPGRGATVPVILGDAQAAWVAEAAAKPVDNASVDHKLLRPYKLAVIDYYSKELVRDEAVLYNALIDRLPSALAIMFDATVCGEETKPGNDFTQLADTANNPIALDSAAYGNLVGAMTTIANAGGLLNGYAVSAAGQGALLAATDQTGRPLFTAGTQAGTLQPILGGIAEVGVGCVCTDDGYVGYAGDWTQAVWGTVAGVELDMSEEATLTLSDNSTVNLWQNNLVAVKAEIEVGFVANEDMFVPLVADEESGK